MICPNCHSENKDGAKFCNECGFPLSGRIARLAAEAEDEIRPASAEPEGIPADTEPDADGALRDEPEPARQADGVADKTAPLRPAGLPNLPGIDVVGVNVDEDGNAFDFGLLGEDDGAKKAPAPDAPPSVGDTEGDRGARAAEQADARRDPAATATLSPADSGGFQRGGSGSQRAVDLTGIDECLVDSGYVPPRASWRSGDTMELPRVEGDAAPKAKEFRAPDANEKRKGGKKKVVAIVLALLVIAAGAAAGATYQMELWGGKILPDVVGMTQADATYMLEGKGFTVRATQVKSDDTEGLVLLMDPGAGMRQEEGTEVVIHVAVARTIPEVVGKTEADARALLEKEGYEQVKTVAQKSDEAEGSVLAIDPVPGTKAKAAAPVTLTVAQPYTVPDVSGSSWDDAAATLEAEGYVAASAYTYTEDVPEGTIVSTDPAAGTKLASGSTVTAYIAKSRAAELEGAASSYLQGAGTLDIGGTSYEIVSVDSVKYAGGNAVSFTVTAQAVTTLDGEVVRGSAKQKSGTITFNDANEIVSVA